MDIFGRPTVESEYLIKDFVTFEDFQKWVGPKIKLCLYPDRIIDQPHIVASIRIGAKYVILFPISEEEYQACMDGDTTLLEENKAHALEKFSEYMMSPEAGDEYSKAIAEYIDDMEFD